MAGDFMIHGMNVKCESEPGLLANTSDPRAATDRPVEIVSARVANRVVSSRKLIRILELACDATLSPEFNRSVTCSQRHAGRSRFSPSLAYGRHFCPPLPTAKAAAVMMLIQPYEGQWAIPLTVRPNHLPDHRAKSVCPEVVLKPVNRSAQRLSESFVKSWVL